MRKLKETLTLGLLVLMMVLSVNSCKKDSEEAIVGTWKVDKIAYLVNGIEFNLTGVIGLIPELQSMTAIETKIKDNFSIVATSDGKITNSNLKGDLLETETVKITREGTWTASTIPNTYSLAITGELTTDLNPLNTKTLIVVNDYIYHSIEMNEGTDKLTIKFTFKKQ